MQPGDDFDQRGFAGAVVAQHAGHLPGAHGQVDALQRDDGAERLAHVLHLDQGSCHRSPRHRHHWPRRAGFARLPGCYRQPGRRRGNRRRAPLPVCGYASSCKSFRVVGNINCVVLRGGESGLALGLQFPARQVVAHSGSPAWIFVLHASIFLLRALLRDLSGQMPRYHRRTAPIADEIRRRSCPSSSQRSLLVCLVGLMTGVPSPNRVMPHGANMATDVWTVPKVVGRSKNCSAKGSR